MKTICCLCWLVLAVVSHRALGQNYAQLKANLYGLTTNGFSLADGNTVVFDSTFSDSVDNYDITKQSNFGENFGILAFGYTLAIEARSNVVNADTIYYRVWNLRPTTYKFLFAPRNFNAPSLTAVLHDNYLNSDSVISLTDTTEVTFVVSAVAASYAQDRFKVIFRINTLPLHFTQISAGSVAGGTQVRWRIEEVADLAAFEVQRSVNARDFITVARQAVATPANNYSWVDAETGEGTWYYRIKAITRAGKTVYSTIVRVAGKETQHFAVSPNPLSGPQWQLHTAGLAPGRYTLLVIAAGGTVVHRQPVVIEPFQSSVSLAAIPLQAGGYTFQLLNARGQGPVSRVVVAGR